MWRNYMTVGWRALLRDIVFTAINLIGLAIGIAGCLMIMLFIRYQTSFDDWLPDAGRTYQVQRTFTHGPNSGGRTAMQAFVASTALPGQFPEIEAATGVSYGNGTFRKDGQPLTFNYVYASDANFLRVLRLPLAAGDPATALADVDSVILTESAARRLFGRTDVLGRTVTRIGSTEDADMRVTGVLRDLPDNTHLAIEAVYRANIVAGAPRSEAFTSWNWISGWVYARLRPGADVAAMNGRMPAVLQRVVPVGDRTQSAPNGLDFVSSFLNVREINTSGVDSGTMRQGTPAKTLITFGIVAAFLLVVACINFINLATARAGRRAREVGLRKALGATRGQLVGQFLTEALVTVGVAGLIAVAVLELSLPLMNDLVGSTIAVRYFGVDGIAPMLIGLLLLVAGVAGAYPAFFLSRFDPAAVLKANRSGAEPPGTGRLRTALVVLQFSVSIALIICTAVVYGQTVYARTADPGYRTSGLLFVLQPGSIGEQAQVETFMRRIAAIPGVTAVARSGITPDPNSVSVTSFTPPGATQGVANQIVGIDGQTFETLGIRLLAGRNVSDQRAGDVGTPPFGVDPARDELIRTRGLNVVIDDAAARAFGFGDPQQAIGRQIVPDSDGEGGPNTPYTIVGVVSHARFESMRFESLPRVFFIVPSGHLSLAVRFENADGAAVMSAIENLWRGSVTRAPFDGFFADRRIANMYDTDERRARLFAIFAGLAVLISCLGLFGLAAFTAERRTKEIGIRKVMGARTRDIVRLLAWQFSKPVIIANLIAWPVAWWAMRNWLSEFESRIDLGPAPFLLAGGLALAIAIGTIAGHALKVARANPIHALRYE